VVAQLLDVIEQLLCHAAEQVRGQQHATLQRLHRPRAVREAIGRAGAFAGVAAWHGSFSLAELCASATAPPPRSGGCAGARGRWRWLVGETGRESAVDLCPRGWERCAIGGR